MINKKQKLSIGNLKNYIIQKLKLKLKYRTSPKYNYAINGTSDILNGVVAYNSYGGYFTPESSKFRPAVQKILKGEIYEPDTIAYMINNCHNGDIIHAGTFFGDFLPGISKGLSEGAMIWAFEPNPENFKCAQITRIINGLENVKLFNAGLGYNKTKAEMLVRRENGLNLGGASKISNGNEKGRTIETDIVEIDELVPAERQISILQLDVEGYEKQALMGAVETIKINKPILILEDNNQIIESDWFKENILKLGYVKTGNVHANTILKVKSP